MLNRFMTVAGSLTLSFSIGIPAEALTGSTQQQATQVTQPSTERKVNVTGCVFRDRTTSTTSSESATNATKATGLSAEEYVLADTKVLSASPGLKVSDGKLFKLNQVEQDKLRQLVGKRVLVSGRIDETSQLADLHAIAIVDMLGLCPAPPTSAS